MPPPDPEGHAEIQETLADRKLLNKVRLRSFTVSPSTIHPFEQATVAWDVDVPASVSSEIAVSFKLDGDFVPKSGSKVVSPFTSHAFQLEVRSEHTGRVLGTKLLQIDASECVDAGLPRRSIEVQAQAVKNLLVAGSLSSRGDLTVAMKPPGEMVFHVPMTADIPNFFNADVNVDLTIALFIRTPPGGQRLLGARLSHVSVDVIFHLAEHIASLGSATAAQAIIQPMAADLIQAFLGPQIQSLVIATLQPIVDIFQDGWQGADPDHRAYRLRSVNAEPEGLIFIGCPVPPAIVPPIVPPTRRTKRVRVAVT